MGTVIKELVTQGHELVALLGTQHGMHDAASLVQRLTAQLDITAVALQEMTKKRDAEHGDVLTWEKTMFKVCGEDGHKSVAAKFAEQEAKCAALAAENAVLKSCVDGWCDTPNTDALLAEVREQGVTDYATKRGFSFQHGSIHAHFGNGDVMVGSVTFENGDAGINFAPVREKTGGIGTHYDWTKGKTAEQVDSVFVIASSNAEGLEVIRDKLSEAIAQLRQDANTAELVAAGIITRIEG